MQNKQTNHDKHMDQFSSSSPSEVIILFNAKQDLKTPSEQGAS